MIWSGLGRWIGKQWKPYLESDNHEIDLDPYKTRGFDILYVYGDSTNRMFADEYGRRNGWCGSVFKR